MPSRFESRGRSFGFARRSPAVLSTIAVVVLVVVVMTSLKSDESGIGFGGGGVRALSSAVQPSPLPPSRPIVVVGLNAALQKRFTLAPGKNLEPGNVHRAAHCETGVGGKGQDVGVSLSCLMGRRRKDKGEGTWKGEVDADRRVLLAQFLGLGPEGDAVASALATKHGLSNALTVRTSTPLRTCTTVVGAGGEATELVEPSGVVIPEEMEELHAKIASEIHAASGVCVMGSMPPGCDDGTYSKLTDRLADESSLILIDSVVGLDPLLKVLEVKAIRRRAAAAIRSGGGKGEGGAVLKINAAELCNLAGLTKSGGREVDRVSVEEIAASAAGFVNKYGGSDALDYLCITDGKHPAYLVELCGGGSGCAGFRTWRMPSVNLSKRTSEGGVDDDDGKLYPIGAGDTVAAGTLAAWQYLHHRRGVRGDGNRTAALNFYGVVSDNVGKIISDALTRWTVKNESENDEEQQLDGEERGFEMATAFAFGLACASASCLKRENSVFDVEDALEFFGDMDKPVMLQ